jgi:hypothetical protein
MSLVYPSEDALDTLGQGSLWLQWLWDLFGGCQIESGCLRKCQWWWQALGSGE